MVVKIFGNFMIVSVIESMGESVVLVKCLGVEFGWFMEFMFLMFFDVFVYCNYGLQIVEQCFILVRFCLVFGLKDVDLVLFVGKCYNVLLLLVSLLYDVLFEVIVYGDGELDWMVLVKVVLL